LIYLTYRRFERQSRLLHHVHGVKGTITHNTNAMYISHRDIWDTQYVKLQLTSGTMPEWKVFLYFLAITIFDWVQFTSFRLTTGTSPVPYHVLFEAWVLLVITIVGVVFLFFCNGGAQGVDFLRRYFPLSIVVGIKFVLVSSLIFGLHGVLFVGANPGVLEWSSIGLLVTINIAMFGRIGFHFRQLSTA